MLEQAWDNTVYHREHIRRTCVWQHAEDRPGTKTAVRTRAVARVVWLAWSASAFVIWYPPLCMILRRCPTLTILLQTQSCKVREVEYRVSSRLGDSDIRLRTRYSARNLPAAEPIARVDVTEPGIRGQETRTANMQRKCQSVEWAEVSR